MAAELAPLAPAAVAENLIVVSDLAKYFPIHAGVFSRHVGDVRAVDGVDLTGKGETLGLVGESGSGKTTAGRVILRLTPATRGQRSIRGPRHHRNSAAAICARCAKRCRLFFRTRTRRSIRA